MYLGLDIGYGQTKLSFCDPFSTPISEVHPSGAAVLENCDQRAPGAKDVQPNGVEVFVDGKPYVSLIDPDQVHGGMSTLHSSFVSSPEYLALFYGALSRVHGNVVTHLVTGVCVDHFKDKTMLAALRAHMSGRHLIFPGRSIEVRKVTIVEKPAGAFLAHIDKQPLGYAMHDSLLVIDCGHFSVDWIMAAAGNFRNKVAGSSRSGGSVVIDAMRGILRERYNWLVSEERMYKYVRLGRPQITWDGIVQDMEVLKLEAAALIAPKVIGTILTALRQEQTVIDRVLVCGGSAPLFLKEVRQALPRAAVSVIESPVMANAVGFRLYAQTNV